MAEESEMFFCSSLHHFPMIIKHLYPTIINKTLFTLGKHNILMCETTALG
jgi:hypothetical protein